MKTTVFKRMLSTILAMVMIFGCFSATTLVAEAARRDNSKITAVTGDIKIAGVDIGYDHGDFFTKDGKACTCHDVGGCYNNSVNSSSSCNCLRKVKIDGKTVDLLAVQCKGFAMYCQYKVFGDSEKSDPGKFTKVTGVSATKDSLKSTLKGCNPGTHIRTSTHSIIVVATDSSNITVVHANYANNNTEKCIIKQEKMTWEVFADWMDSYGTTLDYVMKAPSVSGSSGGTTTPPTTNPPSGSGSGGGNTITISTIADLIEFVRYILSLFKIFNII